MRRRRRGGKRVEGGEGSAPQAATNGNGNAPRGSGRHPAPAPKPRRDAEPGGASQPSLLSRIGRGLKSLVTRGPRSNH